MRRKCPVCGVADCSCGGPTTVIPVDQRVTSASVGGLRAFPLKRAGLSIVLTEEEARAQGLLPAKMHDPALNKMRRTAPNKGRR